MRFLIPSQTISEYRHRKMPVFETLAAIGATTIAGTALTVGDAALAVGAGAAAYGASKLMSGGGPPGSSSYTGGQYTPTPAQFAAAQQAQEANILGPSYNPAEGFAQQFARQGTQQQINLQNRVTPGSSAQRELATNQLNSYIQGQVPQDVQQNINREVAQNLGGGFNLFSGGGQAPQNFARNLGQTSLGLSQYGLSAAPTWQQLANSMVVSPVTGAQIGLQAGEIGTKQVLGSAGIGVQNAENQYQAGYNQWAGQNMQNQQAMQAGLGGVTAATGLINANTMANYYNGLGNQGINQSNISGMLPSASGAQATMSQLGYPNAGSGFTSLPNTGAGTPYPFSM